MPVERFHAREEFLVVSTGDQDLVVGADGGLEDTKRAGGEFMFFELCDFVLAIQIGVRLVCLADRGTCASSWWVG